MWLVLTGVWYMIRDVGSRSGVNERVDRFSDLEGDLTPEERLRFLAKRGRGGYRQARPPPAHAGGGLQAPSCGAPNAQGRVVLEGYVVYPIAALVGVLVAWRAARSGLPAFHVVMRALFVLYIGWLVSATLFPIPVREAVIRAEAMGQGLHVSLVPLASIRETLATGTSFAQLWLIGGNVLTLAPLGFLLPFALPRLATWRRMAAVAFVVPLCIELAQLGVSLVVGYSYRVTEVDDLLLNFAGVLLGCAMYRVVAPRVTAV